LLSRPALRPQLPVSRVLRIISPDRSEPPVVFSRYAKHFLSAVPTNSLVNTDGVYAGDAARG